MKIKRKVTNRKYRALLRGLLVMAMLMASAALVMAQVQGNQWSLPMRLSSAEGTYKDLTNAMVADPYGNIHVFWVETGLDDGRTIIQHARFDGTNWSPPMDIVATQSGGIIGFVSASITADGTLYLLWTGGSNGPVFYATAPAQLADSAGAWSAPVKVDAPAFQAYLLIDSRRIFHLVYSSFYGETPGVYVMQSLDRGQNWTTPIWLDPDIPANFAPLTLKAQLDAADGIHALWAYEDLTAAGADVRYAHSLDGGQTWSLPFTIDAPDEAPDELRMSRPSLAVSGQSVFVIWAGDRNTHREFRFSTDAGSSWGVPLRVFGDLQGQALGDGVAIDALGRLHFIGQIRWPQGLYHYVWDNRSWSAPELFYLIQRNDAEGIGERIHAHNVQLVIGQGNTMVTTFSDGPGGALYAMTRTLTDAPVVPLAKIPTATPVVTPTSAATPVVTPTPAATLTAVATPIAPIFGDTVPVFDPAPITTSVFPVLAPLWLGLVSAALLIAIVIMYQHRKRR